MSSSSRRCPICSSNFKRKADYTDHINNSSCANQLQDTFVECPHCEKSFPSEDNLHFHLTRNPRCKKKHNDAFESVSRVPANATSSIAYGNTLDAVMVQQMVRVCDPSTNQTQIMPLGGSTLTASSISLPQRAGVPSTSYGIPSTSHHSEIYHYLTTQFLDQYNVGTSDVTTIFNTPLSQPIDSSVAFGGSSLFNTAGTDTAVMPDSTSGTEHIEFTATYHDDDEEVVEEDTHIVNNVANNNPIEGNTSIFASAMKLQQYQSQYLVSQELVAMTDLYSMLNRRGVPSNLFDLIIHWACKNSEMLSSMTGSPMSRVQYLSMAEMVARGTNKNSVHRPQHEEITLSTGRQVSVTKLGFEFMIRDMLSNTTLMDPKNILWDDSDFQNSQCHNPSPDDGSSFHELHTGTWWQNAKQQLCNNNCNEILWPIIMFIDGMKISSHSSSLRLEPVTFSFARFKRHVRNQGNAWRTVAFIDEVNQLKFQRGKALRLSTSERVQEYHDILKCIFRDLIALQEVGIHWKFSHSPDKFPYGNQEVLLRIPIQFVIGDCQGHDKLAGRFLSHNQQTIGLCRDCDCPTARADDVRWKCKFRVPDDVRNKTEEELRENSFYAIENAMNNLCFGKSERGLFGALLPEELHVFKSGLFEVIYEGIISSMSAASIRFLNTACQFFVQSVKGTDMRNGIPPFNTFRNGITSTSPGKPYNLSGTEKHARLIVLYCLLSISECFEYVSKHYKKETEYKYHHWTQMIRLLEKTLSLYAWISSPTHKKDTIIGEDGTPQSGLAMKRIKDFMFHMKNWCPALTSSEFRITKFHQCLHFPLIIREHGSLLNNSGSRPESMARHNVKDPACQTQGRQVNLTQQTAKKYLDQLTVIDVQRFITDLHHYKVEWSEPFTYLTPDNDVPGTQNMNKEYYSTGTRFILEHVHDNVSGTHRIELRWENRGGAPRISFDNQILKFVSDRLFGSDLGGKVTDNTIQGFTELTDKESKTIFRAHPSYRNERFWHDWVLIKWSDDNDVDAVPARLEMFLDLRPCNITYNGPKIAPYNYLTPELWAVVWSAEDLKVEQRTLSKYHRPLKLAERWKMEAIRRLVPVTAIQSPCFAYLNAVGSNMEKNDGIVIVMDSPHVWKDTFLRPHL